MAMGTVSEMKAAVTVSVEQKLEFVDVGCQKTLPAGRPSFCRIGCSISEGMILHGISGSARPGEMVAVMGASGSGKTTLLDVISGLKTARVSGHVNLSNGCLNDSMEYLWQRDFFISDLTVYETLKYEALMKLGRKLNFKQKLAWVQEAIKAGGLERCRDAVVKSSIGSDGISSGEMKRLSLTNALMMKRSVLLLDEPTSGMDSNSALEFLSFLEQLTTNRKLVVLCVIHQPSAQMLAKFPRLIWMEGGEIVYQGFTNDLDCYLSTLGLTRPPQLSDVEFLTELTKNIDTCTFLLDAYKKRIKRLPSGLYSLLQHDLPSTELPSSVFTPSVLTCSRPPQLGTTQQIVEASKPSPSTDANSSDPSTELSENYERKATSQEPMQPQECNDGWRLQASWDVDSGSPRYITQVYWYFRRTLRATLTKSMNSFALCQMIVPGLFVGLVMFQMFRNPAEDTLAKVVLGLIFIGFFPAVTTAHAGMNQLHQDADYYSKERSTSAYPVSVFLLAHTLARLVRHTLWITGFFLTIAPLAGIRMSPSVTFSTWATLLLIAIVGDATSLLIWCCVSSEADGSFYILALAKASTLLGGSFAPQPGIPFWLRWLPSVLPWSYAGNVLAQNILWGMSFRCSELNPGPCPIPSQDIIDRFFFWGLSVKQNVAVLVGFALGFYFLSYAIMRFSEKSCKPTLLCLREACKVDP
eukprot:GHVS01068069.1.p1 GENE.GHVS01068069.1~~GHVS01068069.1.p1  ORF type:complete len:696 (+),score=48.42 GHVS01068069.1:183-2270(+)